MFDTDHSTATRGTDEPREHGLQRLDVPVPPGLDRVLGYPGARRWVGFSALAQRAPSWNDGRPSPDNLVDWRGWLHYTSSPSVRPQLAPHAGNWLLMDRVHGRLYAADAANAQAFLARQRPVAGEEVAHPSTPWESDVRDRIRTEMVAWLAGYESARNPLG